MSMPPQIEDLKRRRTAVLKLLAGGCASHKVKESSGASHKVEESYGGSGGRSTSSPTITKY